MSDTVYRSAVAAHSYEGDDDDDNRDDGDGLGSKKSTPDEKAPKGQKPASRERSSGHIFSPLATELLLFKFRGSTTGALSEVSGSECTYLSEESELEITCTQLSASQSQELFQYL